MGCKTKTRGKSGRGGGSRGQNSRSQGYAAFAVVLMAVAIALCVAFAGDTAVAQCGPGGCGVGGGSSYGSPYGSQYGSPYGMPSGPSSSSRGGILRPTNPGGSQDSSGQSTTMAPVQPTGHYASVVQIFAKYSNAPNMGGKRMTGQRGSGVFVSWDGLPVLLTAAHVVKSEYGIASITVTVNGGKSIPVTVLGMDETWDVAVCSAPIEEGDVPLAELERGDAAMQQPGNQLEAVGWGGDGPLAASRGQFKGYSGASGQPVGDWMEISGIARDGDSGGPIFNAAGRVVGVLWGTSRQAVIITGAQAGRILTVLVQHDGVIKQTCRFLRRGPMVPVQPGMPGPCQPAQPTQPTMPLPVPEQPEVAPLPPVVGPVQPAPEPKSTKVNPGWIAAGPVGILVLLLTAMVTFAVSQSWHVTSGAGVTQKRRG